MNMIPQDRNYVKGLTLVVFVLGVLVLSHAVRAQNVAFPVDGGTGTSTRPLSGQILIGNASRTYSPGYITPGTNITISTSSGGVTINSSGGGGGIATSSQGQYGSGNIFLSLNSSTAIAFDSFNYDSSTERITSKDFDKGINIYGYSSTSASLSSPYSSVQTVVHGGNVIDASERGGSGSYLRVENIGVDENEIEGASARLFAGTLIVPNGFASFPGSVSIYGGDVLSELGTPTSTGGDIYIRPGNGNVDGKVWITDPTSEISALLDTSLLADSDKNFAFPNTSGTICLTNTCAKAISATSTQVANAAATQTSLASSTIATSTVPNTGDSFTFRAAGTFAGTIATDKRIKVLVSNLGGATTTVFDSGNLAITSASDWTISGYCMVTGANTQKCATSMNTSFASIGAYADYATSTVTSTQAINLDLRGSGTNASDVVAQVWRVGIEPAP